MRLTNEDASDALLANKLYSVGFGMLEGERWLDAMDVFRAMVLLCPQDERSWLGLGRCHEAIGQEPVALELYSLCTLTAPRTVRGRVALARLLRACGREEHVESVLDDALAYVDDDALSALVHAEQARS